MKINEVKYDPNKKSIIIIEGAQGVGKTSFANYCRENIPFTNLYRLSGISDKSSTGYQKTKDMYNILLEYMKGFENTDINLVFDRTFFSEEIFCRLGYKEYKFSDAYKVLLEKLNDINLNIFVIFLYVDNIELFIERLKREKTKTFTNFLLETSVDQQNEYLKMAKELEVCDNINPVIVATDNFDQAYNKLKELIPPLNGKIEKV